MVVFGFILLSCYFYMNGIFLAKKPLSYKSDPMLNGVNNDKKVITLLVDALREDFVEMDAHIPHYLDT